MVEQSEFPVYEGQHEAIISEEDWYLAQEKRKINSFKREKVNNPDHAHILSGILKCPCCGKSMYGNIATTIRITGKSVQRNTDETTMSKVLFSRRFPGQLKGSGRRPR